MPLLIPLIFLMFAFVSHHPCFSLLIFSFPEISGCRLLRAFIQMTLAAASVGELVIFIILNIKLSLFC